MSATPIADMIEKMVVQNVPTLAIVEVVRAFELSLATVVRQNDDSDDKRRQRDRLWHREKRAKQRRLREGAEANDAARRPDLSPTTRDDSDDKRCDLSSLLTESVGGIREEEKKEAAVVVEGRKAKNVSRATRLTDDWQPDEAMVQFARDHGLDPQKFRDEFVDYWTGIPGQRGTKSNWAGTWRNRVRQLGSGAKGRERALSFHELAEQIGQTDETTTVRHKDVARAGEAGFDFGGASALPARAGD